MSPKRLKRVSIPPQKYIDYVAVARNFYSGADLARAFDYWNAAGVLIIHAAIALSDALTIKVTGSKIRGDDHWAVAELIRQSIVLDKDGHKALTHLIRMIDQKNLVSYSGEIYTRKDIDMLWAHLDRYWIWALAKIG